MNIFHMKQAMSFAKKFSIENGPLYVEADTYRYHGKDFNFLFSYFLLFKKIIF